MNKQEIINTIEESIVGNHTARVYFRTLNRTPMYGKFVKLSDHKEKISKDFVRFVNGGNFEAFDESKHVMHTKLFDITTFHDIKLF